MAMDKYDYKLKSEEMLELMESGAYNRAAEIADTIDWRKVKNTTMLMTVSEIYDKTGDYYRSYNVLNIAYSRESGSRNLINRLCELAIKTGNVDEAIDFYEEFVDIAPKDPTQYILRYKILKANRGPLDQQIEALVKFKRSEYIEEWAYELARKYQEAGMTAECIEECDDLILWFNEGKYVYKAMELKMQYKPLTPSQQERYNHRYEKVSTATEELPDVEEYEKEKERLNVRKQMQEIEDVTPARKEDAYTDDKYKEETPHREEVVNNFDEEHAYEEQAQEELEEAEVKDPTMEDAVDKSLQKLNEKGIVQQMNLEDALMSLLHPEEYQKSLERKAEEQRAAEKEATVAAVESKFENSVIPEYEHALDEIASVIDLNLVNKMVDDAKKAPEKFDKDLEELKPVPIEDETEEIPSVEELAKAAALSDDTEEINIEYEDEEQEDFSEFEEEEDFSGFEEEEDLLGFAEEEDFGDFEDNEVTEEEAEEVEEVFEEEDAFPDFEEEYEIPEEEEHSVEEEEVDMKGNNNEVTPILPPDIQRLIDEIEGVVPVEPEKKPVVEEEEVFEEPHENMGEVTEKLQLDELFDDIDEEVEETVEAKEEVLEEPEEIFDEEEVSEEADAADEFAEFEEAEDLLDGFEEDFSDFEEADEIELEKPSEELTQSFADYVEEENLVEAEDDDLSDFEEDDDFAGFEEEDSLLSLFESDAEEFYDENFDYDDLRSSLEKEFSPVYAEDEDEREIPDDDDDIPDILSATTPLSRMETAKLHATGKTAPLPTGELADALSMSDTGFVVQGRYDLSAQSGVGTRAGLTDDQKKLFSYFVPVRGMSEQLVDVLEQDKNCTNRQGTSKTGNLLIIGNKGNGKTVLAVDIVKAIQKQRNIHHGKVAIVTGESLNKKKISEIFAKLHGGAIIIEKAGKMNEKTVSRLNKNMERDTGELLVVLEEQRKPLDRVLSLNKDFRRKFTSRLEVPILINDELVTFGQAYAEENGYKIDEMGILALYSRIDSLQREDHSVTIAEVKEVMDEAIAHNQKGAAKKLVKKVFKKNTDSNNRIILSENDFND